MEITCVTDADVSFNTLALHHASFFLVLSTIVQSYSSK